MKTFVWTFIIVAVGIYAYNRWKQVGAVGGTITIGPISINPAASNTFFGPDVDPKTGDYLIPGAQAGTVSNPVAPVA